MAIEKAQLRHLFEAAQGPLGLKEIIRLGGFNPGQQTDLKRVLRDMLKAGTIEKTGKRFHLTGTSGSGKPKARPAPSSAASRRVPTSRPREGGSTAPSTTGRRRTPAAPETPLIKGVLHIHPDGYGFVHPLDQDADNIFVPPQEAAKALDNDRVEVRIVPGNDGRSAGEIVSVSARIRQFVIGVYTTRGGTASVMPQDKAVPGPISVPVTQIARDGDVVKVRLGVGAGLLGGGRAGLVGEVAGSIGAPGTPGAEVLNIAYSQGFSDEFPAEVMDEADGYQVTVSEEERAQPGRRDVRGMALVTIDGEDARDFDDAVYVEPKGSEWRLVVAVADVSNYVKEGKPLDVEALRRATSVYLPDRVLPMLPERLSNGICSLKPDEDRLCMIADMVLDKSGVLKAYELYPAVMRSHARCTYNEVQKVLDGEDVPHRNAFKPLFVKLETLAKTLRKMREARGAIDFDLPEVRVQLGPDGLPEKMVSRDRLFAHRIVEECMLAANEAVAKFFQDNDLPSVYRYHGDPDDEKLATFAGVANAYGFELDPDSLSSADLNAFVKKLEGHAEQRALNQLLLRSMMQAVYSSQNVGHYGLAAEHYLHFTSPIRRYPDLLVHRQLKKVWARKGKKQNEGELEREEEQLEAMAVQSSGQERAAMQVEREVGNFYAAMLMKDRVGEEFAAQVAGVADFGFFVQLDVELVDGLVRADSLGPNAQYDAALHALVFAGGRKVRVGQKLTVRLINANMERRQLEFEPVAFEGEDALPAKKTLSSTIDRFKRQGGRGPQAHQRGRDARHQQRETPPAQKWKAKEDAPAAEETFAPKQERPAPPRWKAKEPLAAPKWTAPAEAAPAKKWHAPGEEAAPEHGSDSSSPHPGFDRLRALAAKNRSASGGGEAPAGKWQDRSTSRRPSSGGGEDRPSKGSRGGGARHDGKRGGGKPGGKPGGGGGKGGRRR